LHAILPVVNYNLLWWLCFRCSSRNDKLLGFSRDNFGVVFRLLWCCEVSWIWLLFRVFRRLFLSKGSGGYMFFILQNFRISCGLFRFFWFCNNLIDRASELSSSPPWLKELCRSLDSGLVIDLIFQSLFPKEVCLHHNSFVENGFLFGW